MVDIFSIIKEWIKNRKILREHAEIEIKDRNEISEHKAWVEHKRLEMKMLDRPCPIKGENCFIMCVHYDGGGVFWRHDWDDFRIHKFFAVSPKCKLWK